MLVLTAKLMDRIFVGDDLIITVVHIDRGRIRLGIQAPRKVAVNREVLLRPEQIEAIEKTVKEGNK